MTHAIDGFVAPLDRLRTAQAFSPTSVVAPLRQGFGLMIGPEWQGDELSPAAADYGAALSRDFPIAYVATEYFGGEGEQRACAWRGGVIVVRYTRGRIGTINAALEAIGVQPSPGNLDAFDSLGLGEHRRNEAWIRFAQSGQSLPDRYSSDAE